MIFTSLAPGSSRHLLQLPIEVHHTVFEWLGIRDLFECLLVCKDFRAFLSRPESRKIWERARQSNRPNPIPAPLCNLSEWRYATMLFGSHMCKVCGEKTDNPPYSSALRVFLCSSAACALLFLARMCRPAKTEEEIKACSYLIPARAPSTFNQEDRTAVLIPPRYISAQIQEALVLGRPAAEPLDVAKIVQLDEEFAEWTMRQSGARDAMKYNNRDLLNKWFSRCRWKSELVWSIPRVQLAFEYLNESHLSFGDTRSMTALRISKTICDSVDYELRSQKALIQMLSSKKKLRDLSCVQCVSKGISGWPRWFSFQGITDHLRNMHDIHICRREDILIKEHSDKPN